MSYKIGDEVIIRNDFDAVESAEDFKGKKAKIMEVEFDNISYKTYYILDIDEGRFYWKDYLLTGTNKGEKQ